MPTFKQPCLIQQANCGLTAHEPVCHKCGLDTRVCYISEEAALLAKTQAQTRYLQNHVKNESNHVSVTDAKTDLAPVLEVGRKTAESHGNYFVKDQFSDVGGRGFGIIVAYSFFCFIAAIAIWLLLLNLISIRSIDRPNAVISFSANQPKPVVSDFSSRKIYLNSIIVYDGDSVGLMVGDYDNLMPLKEEYSMAKIIKLDSIISLFVVGLTGGALIFFNFIGFVRKRFLRNLN